MLMATAKQVTTIATQRALPRPDLDEEMWLSPWIVEFSKNSERMAKAILSNGKPEYQLFIQHLHNLGLLNILVNSKELHLDLIKSTIDEIGNCFQLLQENFQMSMTLKIHIILHHYVDHFTVTGETLLKYTDESVEAMHSQIRQFEESHYYTNHKVWQ